MNQIEMIEARNIGAFIRLLRERHGVSQGVMGEAIGLHAPEVSRLENGHHRLKVQTVIEMLDMLGYRVRMEVSPK